MKKSPDLVLRNVTLPDGRVKDISVSGAIVSHAGASQAGADSIECGGMLVIPAAIDMHVHMRGGVQSTKEDWSSGSRAALAGGVTIVVDQPNTIPPLTDAGTYKARVEEAKSNSFCNFAVNGGVTPDADLSGMWNAGAMAFGEIFAAPSSYGEGLNHAVLEKSFQKIASLDALATVHAENVIEGEDRSLEAHDLLRSGAGEADAVRKVLEMAPRSLRLHLCHLSCPESIRVASGRASVEVTPHHLFLSIEKFRAFDTHGRVNPPLRHEETRRSLWECWDSVDVIASDHAPHTISDKDHDFGTAPSGIPGVETMVPLLLAEHLDGKVTLESIIRKTSTNPARILRVKESGYETGCRADFAIYRPEKTVIKSEELHSKAGWTPYEGMYGVFPEIVIMNGRIAYEHGEYIRGDVSWYAGDGLR